MVISCGFSCCFRIEKKQNQTGNRPKSEKKRENEQVHFGKKCTLFGCTNLSPNSAANALDLFAFAALADFAAVTLGVGRFGVIVEQQLQ
jgi:hypothetical protein